MVSGEESFEGLTVVGNLVDVENPTFLEFKRPYQFNHMLRPVDRRPVELLIDWASSRGFDVYLSGSVAHNGLNNDIIGGGFDHSDDIDLYATPSVGREDEKGIFNLVKDVMGDDGLVLRDYEKDDGTVFNYSLLLSSLRDPSINLGYYHDQYILCPERISPEGLVRDRGFTNLDLHFVSYIDGITQSK